MPPLTPDNRTPDNKFLLAGRYHAFATWLTQSRGGRVLTVTLVCAASFFLHLGAPAVSLMESRNFVAAREMVAGGSWLIPTMNGELRLAKPPLPTWAVAALQQLTGPTENLTLLRLPAALAATLFVFFFWGLVRELTRDRPGEAAAPGQTAWLAALVLATSLLVITTGREGQWDIFATSLLTGGLWLLVGGWQRPPGRRAACWLAGAGTLVGLSCLSKGPVPLYALLLPFLLAYLIGQPVRRRAVRARAAATGGGGLLAVLVGGSWPLYIWLQVAPAARAVARVEMSSWGVRHVQPFWYYWPFFAFTGLWAAVALVGLVWPYARPRVRDFIPYALALGWVAAGLVLLSIVPEKKERYMLPLMPPLALLVAGVLRYWQTRPAYPAQAANAADAWILRAWGSLLAVVVVGLPAAMAFTNFPGFGVGSWRFAVMLGGAAGLAGVVARWGVARRQISVLIGSTLVTALAIIGLVLPAYPRWEGRRDVPDRRYLRQARELPALNGVGVWYSLDTLHVKQVWAAGRPVPIWHPTTSELAELWQSVTVLSAEAAAERLPAGWSAHVRVVPLDTFYLDRDRNSAVWFISRLDPIKEGKH